MNSNNNLFVPEISMVHHLYSNQPVHVQRCPLQCCDMVDHGKGPMVSRGSFMQEGGVRHDAPYGMGQTGSLGSYFATFRRLELNF